LGGRDQEDLSLKPAQANSSQDPHLEDTHQEKGLEEKWLKWYRAFLANVRRSVQIPVFGGKKKKVRCGD
jgi:hypothetical protein